MFLLLLSFNLNGKSDKHTHRATSAEGFCSTHLPHHYSNCSSHEAVRERVVLKTFCVFDSSDVLHEKVLFEPAWFLMFSTSLSKSSDNDHSLFLLFMSCCQILRIHLPKIVQNDSTAHLLRLTEHLCEMITWYNISDLTHFPSMLSILRSL